MFHIGNLAGNRLHIAIERGRDVIAIGVLRHECGEIGPALRGGIGHDPLDFVFGLEAQKINAVSGDAAIRRKRNDGHAAVARNRRHRRDRLREQRPQNDLRAFGEQVAGCGGGFVSAAAFIGGHQHDVAVAGIEHRHFGGVEHAGRQRARGGRAVGKRQDDAHPHRCRVGLHIGQAQEARLFARQRMRGVGELRRRRRWGQFGLPRRGGAACQRGYRHEPGDGTKAASGFAGGGGNGRA
jgi:hypothetical protein